MRKTLFSLLLGAIICHQCFSQGSVHFENMRDVDEAFRQNIFSIFQDHQGYLWFGTGDGIIRYDGIQIKKYSHDPTDSTTIGKGIVVSFYEDPEGYIWVLANALYSFNPESETFKVHLEGYTKRVNEMPGSSLCGSEEFIWIPTLGHGLIRFNRITHNLVQFKHDPLNQNSITSDTINIDMMDHSGKIWIGTKEKEIDILNPQSGDVKHYYLNHPPNQHGMITNIFEDSHKNIWISESSKIYLYTPSVPNTFKTYFFNWPNRRSNGDFFKTMVETKDNTILISSQTMGVHALNTETGIRPLYQNGLNQKFGLSSNKILAMYLDIESTLWISTDNGLFKLNHNNSKMQHFQEISGNPKGLSGIHISCIYQAQDNSFWIGTKGNGLNHYDPKRNKIQAYRMKSESPFQISSDHVTSFTEDHNGILWVGFAGKTADWFDPETGFIPNLSQSVFPQAWIENLFVDSNNNLWLGAASALIHLDLKTQNLTPYYWNESQKKIGPFSKLGFVQNIHEDENGLFWVGIKGFGLFNFDRTNKTFRQFIPNSIDSEKFAQINKLFEDSDHNLWIGTNDHGLFCRSPGSTLIAQISKQQGLPSNDIQDMVQEQSGAIWIGTSNGLCKINTKGEILDNFNIHDGFLSNNITALSINRSTGSLLVGTNNGLTIVTPDELIKPLQVPNLTITSLTRYNSSKNGGKPIEVKGISSMSSVELSYRDKILVFEAAVLSFTKPGKNQYAYKLEGFNEDWIDLGTENKFSFTNLAPGKYTLRVKGANGDGNWNHQGISLEMRIMPSWYWNHFTRFLYLITFGGIIYLIYRNQMQKKLALAEANRLTELDLVKTRLYTNITHEFRTPLTVIQGMADQITGNEEAKILIQRNSNDLLQMVNQMLELRKLESGSIKPDIINGSIISYLKYILESFHSLANSKNINLKFETTKEEILMDYDPKIILGIVSNLLSNAIKFTGENGTVAIHVSHNSNLPGQLKIIVKDDGIGISPKDLNHIFDRFYQSENSFSESGTGIGLALTKNLVSLINGEIQVKSQKDKGSAFIINLPITNNILKSSEASDPPTFVSDATHSKLNIIDATMPMGNSLPLILLVEDNQDVVFYLSSILKPHYHLEIAVNGEDGVNKALKQIPDLIISDVMMPKKDGFVLTNELKSNIRTSHIPIILLTAKADMPSKIEGLKRGADVYLAKPFHEEELLIRIEKLLDIRKTLRNYYLSNAPAALPDGIDTSTDDLQLEHKFVTQVKTTIEDHIHDIDLNVKFLCKELLMSHSQLHRKLTALTGLSTNRYIRFIRLKHAKQLLRNHDLPINHVAYDSGFSDPDYFSRLFKKEFNLTPSQYKARFHNS